MTFRHFRYSHNNYDVKSPIALVEGNTLNLKLDGVLAEGKAHHYTAESNGSPCSLEIRTKATEKRLEQSISVHLPVCVSPSRYTLRAVFRKPPKAGNIVAPPVASLDIEALPRIKLPPPGSDEWLVACLLLAEALTPLRVAAYGNGAEVRESMDLMKQVLDNRLYVSSTKLARAINLAPKGANLRAIISAPNQFKGFEGGNISAGVQDLIRKFLAIANDGTHSDFRRVRAHVEYAIKVAKRPASFPSRITTSTPTHWRTISSSNPSDGVTVFRDIAGQRFWTPSEKFLKDNPQ